MVEFYATDYIANSMLYHVYKQHLLDVVVGPESSVQLKVGHLVLAFNPGLGGGRWSVWHLLLRFSALLCIKLQLFYPTVSIFWARCSANGRGVGRRLHSESGSWSGFSASQPGLQYVLPFCESVPDFPEKIWLFSGWPPQVIVLAKYEFQLPPGHPFKLRCVAHINQGLSNVVIRHLVLLLSIYFLFWSLLIFCALYPS